MIDGQIGVILLEGFELFSTIIIINYHKDFNNIYKHIHNIYNPNLLCQIARFFGEKKL